MKFAFFTLVTAFIVCFQAQGQPFTTKDIAAMEAVAHGRLAEGRGASLASANFDVNYYRCRWEVDPAVRYISGSVTLYFTLTAPATSITLDMMGTLTADSVKQRQNSLSFNQINNTLEINFPSQSPLGAKDSLTVFYKGIPAETGFGSFIQSTHAGIPVMWSLSEPYGARDWWPCKNGLDDKADSIDIYVTHPAIYKAAANGLLQSETAVAGNKVVTHWKHRYPIATYLIAMAVTNYTVFNNTVQLGSVSLPMQTHCYPENLALFQNNTQKVLNAMQFFHANFGDYPFIKEKYGHVQFGWGGGMEHQTATFLVTPDESLMAHELGHQWFGDKLTTHSWEDIWLNEGFATYLAAVYMEQAYPANIYVNRRAVINNITSQPGGSVKVDDTSNVSRIFSNRLSYNKGSYLLYMLRWIVGDSTFTKAIKNYQSDPALAYNFTNTQQLKRHMEQASGKNLTYFFNQWYTGQGQPTYNVQWSQLGSSSVRITMNQTTSHPSVSFFQLPVALRFKNATQEKTVVVDNNINGEVFTKNIGFIADTVLVDPEYWIISKNNTTQKVSLPNSGNGAIDINPNPVNNPMTIYFHDFNATTAEVHIVNAGGQLVYKNAVRLFNGSELLSIPTQSWSKGLYIVHVKAGDKKIVQRILR
ncbi:MAG: T9SS type A sorting domain-containing protein [Chitinophagaceae bacterium]|nr:MAG: T9SS type A sorting domain-containing protein [Chitinophagaceae bacterium]